MSLFKYSKTRVNQNNIVVHEYIPTKNLFVDGCDINKNLEIKKCKITKLTVHEFTDLWRILVDEKSYIDVSGQHSIIVEKNNKLTKVSPVDLFQSTYKDYNIVLYINKDIVKIPVYSIQVTKLSDKERTYDFSLDGGNAFIANNILVMDTVSIFMPQLEESQSELKHIVTTHTILPSNSTFKYIPKWDSVYGIYVITKNITTSPFTARKDESLLTNYQQLKKYLISNPDKIYHFVNLTFKNTKISISLGKLLFNLALPQSYPKIHTEVIDKKTFISILTELSIQEFAKFHSNSNTIMIYDELCSLGNIFATIFPIRYDLFALDNITKKVENTLNKLEKENVLKNIKTINSVMDTVKKAIEKENKELYDVIESGAVSSWNDIQQIVVAKGYVMDIESKVINEPIKSSLLKGLDSNEFFISSYSNRKGIIDRALNTSEPGYLLRQLSVANNHIVLGGKDCKTKNGLEVKITEKNFKKYLLRYTIDGILLNNKNIHEYINKKVVLRSPMYCIDKEGICRKCYGELSSYLDSIYIGVIASQSIGERLQQTMLKTFHVTSVVKLDDIPQIIPSSLSLISQKDNKIKITAKDNSIKIILSPKDCEYKIVMSTVTVYSGVIRIIGTNKNEMFSFNNRYSSIDFYPDMINKNIDLSNIIGDEDENAFVMTFNKKHDYIGEISVRVQDISAVIKEIKDMFAGKIEFSNPVEVYDKMYNIIEPHDIDSVHLEIIISNMLRVKDNEIHLWRFHQESTPTLLSIKSVIEKDSHVVFVSFEDTGKALVNSITGKKEIVRKSIIEEIIDGNLENI